MGTIITIILAVLIFGYGGYQTYQTINKGSKGECHGCSSSGSCEKGSCNTSLGFIDLSEEMDESNDDETNKDE